MRHQLLRDLQCAVPRDRQLEAVLPSVPAIRTNSIQGNSQSALVFLQQMAFSTLVMKESAANFTLLGGDTWCNDHHIHLHQPLQISKQRQERYGAERAPGMHAGTAHPEQRGEHQWLSQKAGHPFRP